MSGDYIYDDGEPEGEPDYPANVRPLVRRPDGPARATGGGVPSCPYCGKHGTADRVNHPSGAPWYCSCGSLFTGSTQEWRRLEKHREMAAKRRSPDSQEAS